MNVGSTKLTIFILTVAICFSENGCGFVLTETSYELCPFLLNVDCLSTGGGSVCGSDSVTYINECELTKVICANHSVRLEHEGPCDKERLEQDLVLNVTCRDILQMDCYAFKGGSMLCASNARTYANECYFEKARCYNHSLYLKHYGRCSTT